jgi:hypothetical protein
MIQRITLRQFPFAMVLLCCITIIPRQVAVSHEFYVGLTEINYNIGTRTYEAAIKVFTDDLELAVSRSFGHAVRIESEKESSQTDSLIFIYTSRHFAVSADNKQPIKLKPLGRETRLDITWLYFESEPTELMSSISVFNEMLMEVYKEQSHIVHYIHSGRTRSELLHSGRRTAIFLK